MLSQNCDRCRARLTQFDQQRDEETKGKKKTGQNGAMRMMVHGIGKPLSAAIARRRLQLEPW